MAAFDIHTIETAPDQSKSLLENSQKGYGMIPNLHGVLAESPKTLEAYKVLGDLFSQTSLSKVEQNVVWLAINVEHHCHYCVPAHTMIAKSQGVDDATIEALRTGGAIADPKLEALRSFALKVVRQRGAVDEADVAAFLSSGFTKENILDVVLGVSHKVLSNYVNHLADTPVDPAFSSFAWDPKAVAAE